MKLEQGLIQVYTGNGKGKTTAALGLALRAVGRQMRVSIIQFMKGGGPYGEHLAAPLLSPYLTIVATGRPGWVNRENPDPEDVRLGIVASRIAAHAADIVKGVKGASQWDLKMSQARKRLDWEEQAKLSIDPERARKGTICPQ